MRSAFAGGSSLSRTRPLEQLSDSCALLERAVSNALRRLHTAGRPRATTTSGCTDDLRSRNRSTAISVPRPSAARISASPVPPFRAGSGSSTSGRRSSHSSYATRRLPEFCRANAAKRAAWGGRVGLARGLLEVVGGAREVAASGADVVEESRARTRARRSAGWPRCPFSMSASALGKSRPSCASANAAEHVGRQEARRERRQDVEDVAHADRSGCPCGGARRSTAPRAATPGRRRSRRGRASPA